VTSITPTATGIVPPGFRPQYTFGGPADSTRGWPPADRFYRRRVQNNPTHQKIVVSFQDIGLRTPRRFRPSGRASGARRRRGASAGETGGQALIRHAAGAGPAEAA